MKSNLKASKKSQKASSKSTSTKAQNSTLQNTSNSNAQSNAPAVGSSTMLCSNLDNLKLGLETVKREYERTIEELHNYDRKLQFLLLIWTALLSVLSIVFTSIYDMDKFAIFTNIFIIISAVLMILALGYMMTASLPNKLKNICADKMSELQSKCITQEDYLNELTKEYVICKKSVEKAVVNKYKSVRASYIIMALAIFFSCLFIYLGMFILL